MSEPPSKTVTLPNGLRCLFIDVPGELFFSGLYVKCGFDDETDATLQAAHFLEHLNAAFTSSKYPDSKRISAFFDRYGVRSNASTDDKESTYWMEGPVVRANKLLDIFVRSVCDFQIDGTIVPQEARAVMQELRDSWKNDVWYAANQGTAELLYKGHIRDRDADAHINNVRDNLQHKPQALLDFRKKFYVPAGMVWVVSGPLATLDPLMKRSMRRLGGMPRTTRPAYPALTHVPVSTEYVIRTARVTSARVTVIYKIPIVGSHIERVEALMLLKFVFTRGFSSRLMRRLRTQLGLVYGARVVVSVDECQPEFSTVRFETTCKPDLGVARQIVGEMLSLMSKPLSADELSRLKLANDVDCSRRSYDLSPTKVANECASRFLWTGQCVPYRKLFGMRSELLAKGGVQAVHGMVQSTNPIVVIALPPVATSVEDGGAAMAASSS